MDEMRKWANGMTDNRDADQNEIEIAKSKGPRVQCQEQLV